MKTQIATALIASVLAVGGTLAFQTNAQTTFTAIDNDTAIPLNEVQVRVETPITQTQTYTKADILDEIQATDREINLFQVRKAELVTILNSIQTELDKLPARTRR